MERCTYLIPAYNRAHYLRRHLHYLQNQGWKGPVLVADSSTADKAPEHAATVAAYAGVLNLSHVIFDSKTPLFTKLAKAAEQIHTPFVALCADDDFLIPSSVEKAVHFLDSHSDYTVVCGRALTVVTHEKHLELRLYRQRAVEERSPAERLENLLRNFSSVLWEVYQRDACLTAMRSASTHTYQSIEGGFAFRFPELSAACASVIEGRVGMIPALLSVRQTPGTHELFPKKIYGWSAMLVHKDFSNHYERFSKGITALLHKKTGIGTEGSELVVNKAFLGYLHGILAQRHQTLLERAPDGIWLRFVRSSLSPDSTLLAPILKLLKQYPDGIV